MLLYPGGLVNFAQTINRMKYLLIILFIGIIPVAAQTDNEIKASLQKSVTYLSDDKLEGRRTGTAGEKLAYEYISRFFKNEGIGTVGNNGTYLQPFEVNDGKVVTPKSYLQIGDNNLVLNDDYFPMPYAAADSKENLRLNPQQITEIFISALIDSNKTNPHFILQDALSEKVKEAEKKGAAIVFIIDTTSSITYSGKDKTAPLNIPVFYLTGSGTRKYITAGKQDFRVSYRIETVESKRQGHNVVGYINNNAPQTVVLGAHYDHLGYGEDKNSLYAGTAPMIHNGADDNASGTAALLELGKILKNTPVKKFNYLLVAFSGEELGLYGSKYFTENSPVDLKTVNYMINMDMIGRLNDSTRGITIGGYGTSPAWQEIVNTNDNYFAIKLDSAGSGPSDHTSFYRKDIPVLFFFTGTHSDYHKPSDDAEKINYDGQLRVIRYIQSVIEKTAAKDKLVFTKTREAAATGRSSFKVSMGIMPDYTFSGNGVLVEGVSEGRAAQKAGVKAGDVILQLGEHEISDVQTYMKALNKFNKGEATKVKIKRAAETIELSLVF